MTDSQEKSMFKNPIVRMFIAIITIAIFATVGVYFTMGAGGDIAPPKDDDVVVPYKNISKDKNAYVYMEKASKECVETTQDEAITTFFSKRNKSQTEINAFVKTFSENKVWDKNQKALAAIDKALACEDGDYTTPNFNINTPIVSLLKMKKLSHLMQLRALQLAQQNKNEEAWQMGLKAVHFGYKMEQTNFCLILYMIGSSLKVQACRNLQTLLSMTKLSSAQSQTYISQLVNYEDKNKKFLAHSYRKEYMFQKQAMDFLKSGKHQLSFDEHLKMIFLFQRNRTLANILKRTKELVAACGKNFNEITQYKNQEPESEQKQWRNFYGNEIIKLATPSLWRFFVNAHKVNSGLQATCILIALKSYKQEQGKLPKELKQLQPKYIDKIPVDSYDGKEMRYSLPKKTVYSQGREEDQEYKDQWTHKINF